MPYNTYRSALQTISEGNVSRLLGDGFADAAATQPGAEAPGAPEVSDTHDTEGPDALRELELAGLRARLRTSQKAVALLQERLHDALEFRSSVFALTPQSLPPQPFVGRLRSGGGEQSIPLICLSDEQVGEVVRNDEMDGFNEYNVKIYRARIRRYITRVIQIIKKREPECSGVVLWLGGDAISGGIHQELAETDEVPPLDQARIHITETVAAIRALADAFKEVRVYCTPGNHGRTTHKPRSKRYTAMNYERVIYDSIEGHFANDDRVSVSAPPSGDVYVQIGGLRVLFTHGDRIGRRGGHGAIGPAATILGGTHKTRTQMSDEGRPVDLLVMGHFHYPMAVGQGVIVNGTPVGMSEYAKFLRMASLKPTQTLVWISPKRGVEGVEWVSLD